MDLKNSTSLFGSDSSTDLQDQLPDSTQRVRLKPPGSSFKALSLSSPTTSTARYRECLKNHAATSGGNVLDGCGEFMPAGDDALKCAACTCHRNFHRKEPETVVDIGGFASMVHPLQLPLSLPSPSPVKHGNRHWMGPPVKIAFAGGGGSGGAESSSEDLNFNVYHSGGGTPADPHPTSFVSSKKRFRTKFSPEQKEKMLDFAEKVGWRIPREDDPDAQRFCLETGVKRHVLKVWMHNNKSAKKVIGQQPGENE
ncbi:zinc-finger homeodomain protein 5 [Impatiens glandulifera]|uniref:zinc-finger homeodomain protein 5 n=1 Tax=Impatiens glandulifera TaxID=253017 RepID=UPI001FB078DD|nr:zinc-finger homeodomain protein 5 [Impatiens glandulifera]